MHDNAAMAGVGDTTIRLWEGRDREQIQALMKLLSQDALVRSEDAPTYVAEKDGEVVGMVTLCVFRTLTGPKAYLDHLVVAGDDAVLPERWWSTPLSRRGPGAPLAST